MGSTVQHSTVQSSTVQYNTVQYSPVQSIQYSTVHYSAVQHSTVQSSTAPPPPPDRLPRQSTTRIVWLQQAPWSSRGPRRRALVLWSSGNVGESETVHRLDVQQAKNGATRVRTSPSGYQPCVETPQPTSGSRSSEPGNLWSRNRKSRRSASSRRASINRSRKRGLTASIPSRIGSPSRPPYASTWPSTGWANEVCESSEATRGRRRRRRRRR